MGSTTLKMEHIREEKSRITTFEKRKNSLMKKVYELTILCDVSACIIINGPTQTGGPPKPEIWPSNPSKVRDMINTYKDQKVGVRTFNLSYFFNNRLKKTENKLKKAHEQNARARYPTWIDFMNNFSENHLREFANALNNKLETAKSKVELIKGNECSYRGTRLASPTSPNSLMMLVMNDNDFVQLSGASGGPQYALPIKRELCCDSMPGVIESVIDENNTPRMLMKYYSPILKPSPPYIHCTRRFLSGIHGSRVIEYDD